MVDRSLMGLAADRGVTIAFADLDGADGLWVPEERTILVNRGLSESRMNEVIEHELGHVAIDDQHAELDAGVFRPPPGPLQTLLSKRWATPALSAAAFLALVGGVWAGLAATLSDGGPQGITTPSPVGGTDLPAPGEPTTTVVPTVDAQGRRTYVTITITKRPGTPVTTPTPTVSPTGIPPLGSLPGTTTNPPPPPSATSSAPAQTTTNPPPTTTNPPVITTEPPATTDVAGPTGDTGEVGDTSTVAGPVDDSTVPTG